MPENDPMTLRGGQFSASAAPSPVPAEGTDLLTCMAARLSASFASLGCPGFGLTDTVQLTLNGGGAAAAATLILDRQGPR